jgi:hypothetical protein
VICPCFCLTLCHGNCSIMTHSQRKTDRCVYPCMCERERERGQLHSLECYLGYSIIYVSFSLVGICSLAAVNTILHRLVPLASASSCLCIYAHHHIPAASPSSAPRHPHTSTAPSTGRSHRCISKKAFIQTSSITF